MPYSILLVDDDPDFRAEFRDLLEEYDVLEASHGQAALELLTRPNEIALVILDVKMPGLPGTEVLRRSKEIAPSLPVIILTGYSSKDVAIEALKGRADDYIEKPIDPEKARTIVRKLLEVQRGGDNLDAAGPKATVERVKQFAERNYDKRVTLRDAAELVCLSPKYLSRIFKEITGKTFTQYRKETKTEKAKELLSQTGHAVSQIAEKLGYHNTESFIRLFRDTAGLTPTEYRKKEERETVG
jgi:YesN/AraC family two-component response regulator